MILIASIASLILAPGEPEVVRIEPSVARIPATTLRLYVVFDRPARGHVRQRDLRLLDGTGTEVEAPFMDFGQDLWSPDGTRLTVLFDPGRVKRDVVADGADAAPLQPGRRYSLSLGDYRQTFVAGSADRRPLDPTVWVVAAPDGPSVPVRVTFDRVMDAALLENQMSIVDADGIPVAGAGQADPDDRVWTFTPAAPWAAQDYRIRIGAVLEDLSGNRVGEALDHDAGSTPASSRPTLLPFRGPAYVATSSAVPDS